MSDDIIAIWQHLFGGRSERVPTVLVGHSMGGGLVVWAAITKRIPSLEGIVVIDVVEGTALGAWVGGCCSADGRGSVLCGVWRGMARTCSSAWRGCAEWV